MVEQTYVQYQLVLINGEKLSIVGVSSSRSTYHGEPRGAERLNLAPRHERLDWLARNKIIFSIATSVIKNHRTYLLRRTRMKP